MRVAVIGGGYAGLTAAVTLAGRGIPVTLYEAARQLGGRARGIAYRGTILDNGQHILLGAYHETLRLLEQVGGSPAALLRLPLELAIPGRFELKAAPLPAPLHLVAGLLGARGLSFSARLRALRFMLGQHQRRFRLAQDCALAQLLRQHRQDGDSFRFLWEPLCLAALNTPPEGASAQVFLNVLRDSLGAQRSASDLLLPRTDFSSLFPDRAASYLEQHGAKLQLAQPVRGIQPGPDGFLLKAGSQAAHFSHVVCAVAPHALPRLAAGLPQLAQAVGKVAAFDYQPIYTLYLQYPDNVRLPRPMLGMTGGLAQWVFDRGRTHHQHDLLAAVISAVGPHQQLPHDALAQRIHGELEARFGLPQPLWHKVIAEKRATFSCTPGLARPPQATPLRNVYLAGDYTAGDYPATLEAAVRSGVKCAQLILENP